ncbi:phosphotransferase [Calidifontibacter indicus]|uniref:phosphotransferase n=1 Tax=Calidifontibacter indicus TaxID=419650 RepID=UPI003D751F82
MTSTEQSQESVRSTDQWVDRPATLVWTSREWLREATAWIDESLERRGITRVPTSPLQPRVRPWSTQLVVDTDHGRVWFKAAAPSMTPEVPIYSAIGDVAPDLLQPLWASDAERGWLLSPDQGPVLRDGADAETVTPLTSAVLRRYARLQKAAVKVADRLCDNGVPRLEPYDLVREWDAQGFGPRATTALADAADRLLAAGFPTTIQHDDLHLGNVFGDGSTAGAHDARIFDWGDAYVGHPLCSLLIPLRSPSAGFGLPEDPERDARLVRAYLTCWSELGSSTALSALLPDALLLARVGRILGWQRALAHATDAQKREWAQHPQRWIDEVVELAG